MISIPYTYIAISFLLLCGFFWVGQLDEEIGWFLGLSAGIFALILNHYWPGGYGGLVLHAIVGLGLLTGYKTVRSLGTNRRPDREEDPEHRDDRNLPPYL